MVTILVQMAEEKWTMEALHLACALARSTAAQVALLRTIQVPHPGYLGTTFGDKPPDKAEYHRLKEYAATAEDYRINLEVHSMQCLSSLDAVVEAADSLDAVVVFAQVLPSRIVYWRTFQIWNLRRRLALKHRQLFTLDQPRSILEWTPSIVVRAIAIENRRSVMSHLPMQDKNL